jgi:hypothetical protein
MPALVERVMKEAADRGREILAIRGLPCHIRRLINPERVAVQMVRLEKLALDAAKNSAKIARLFFDVKMRHEFLKYYIKMVGKPAGCKEKEG